MNLFRGGRISYIHSTNTMPIVSFLYIIIIEFINTGSVLILVISPYTKIPQLKINVTRYLNHV